VSKLPKTLPAPALPESLDQGAKWLAGEGAGSWFVIHLIDTLRYQIKRYSPIGTFECGGIYHSNLPLVFGKEYTVTYPSDCQIVTILQLGKKIRMVLVEKGD